MSIRSQVKQALGAVGYYRSRLSQQPYAGVAVLAYHAVRRHRTTSMWFQDLHVSAERFAAQLDMLRTLDCTFLAMSDWREIAGGARSTPPRAVMVTFDDGYRSVATEALPILERYNVPAAVFVATTPIERQIRFWFDAVAERKGETAVETMKSLPYAEWREAVDELAMPAAADDPHAPASLADLRLLAAHPLVTIGAHTASHPILANAGRDVQRSEILRSRESLEQWVSAPVTTFAYPNGRAGIDFTSETEREVEAAGFEHAFAIGSGFADPRSDRYAHPRFLVLDAVEPAELAHRLAVAWPAAQGSVR